MNFKNVCKKFVMTLSGGFLLILGITLILSWRYELLMILRGMLGFIAALIGIFILYLASSK
jgi:hypothetical protein